MRYLKKFHNRTMIHIVLLLTGFAALMVGIYRGEVKTVLTKAIYICLECIGIG